MKRRIVQNNIQDQSGGDFSSSATTKSDNVAFQTQRSVQQLDQMRNQSCNRTVLWLCISIILVTSAVFLNLSMTNPAKDTYSSIANGSAKMNVLTEQHVVTSPSCAICFFGLPRSFELLVLPSIIQNVLLPNQRPSNRCDIYLHYYSTNREERKSRSSAGGTLKTDQVRLISNHVERIYNNNNATTQVYLSIVQDTDASFLQQRGTVMKKYLTTKGNDGTLLYYPWKAKSYQTTSVENIVKQWHSISQVWKEMEIGAKQLGKEYVRIAMLRNDVVFVTPFDIYQVSNSSRDDQNQKVVIPNWARFPINDRMVYGPYDAIKIWATERFDRLEAHVQSYESGYGLHSERFLNHSIFPAIRQLGYSVVTNPEICFLRARADGTVWINDCATRDGAATGFRNLNLAHRLVEELIGRPCVRGKFKKRVIQVDCSGYNMTNVSVQ